MKTITTTSGKIFVRLESDRMTGNGGFVAIDEIRGLAIPEGTPYTKVINRCQGALMTPTPVLEIVGAAPSKFIRVTLGSSEFPEEGQKTVWLHHDSISGFADMGGGQVVIFTDAMPAPMPVLETIDQLVGLFKGTKTAVAQAA